MSDATQNTAPATEEQATLGLADLKNVLIIMDLASSRGAFKPSEFTAVGSVYSKITAFLEAAAPAGSEEGSEAAGEAAA